MSTDFTKIQLTSTASSLKVWKESTTSVTVASLGGAGETHSSVSIPHGYTSDLLLFQVADTTNGVILPWENNDGRVIEYARLDGTNLYIFVNHNSSGGAFPGSTINFSYRLLIP